MSRAVHRMDEESLRTISGKLKVLAHPTRLRILALLERGAMAVGSLQRKLDIPQAQVSQHLAARKSHGIIDYSRDGKMHVYYLREKAMVGVLRCAEKAFPAMRRGSPRKRPGKGGSR